MTASSSRYANHRTSLEILTGETPDITEYLDFGMYDWVRYKQNAGLGEPQIGRWLGVSHRVGPLMSYWILPKSGIPISCVTVQPLSFVDQQTDENKERMRDFTEAIAPKMNAPATVPLKATASFQRKNKINFDNEDEEFITEYNRVICDDSIPEADTSTPDSMDEYIHMQLSISTPDGEPTAALVKKRALDTKLQPIGKANNNPLLDTRQYEVEFIDGHSEILSANIIAENLLSQVDAEGHHQKMLAEISEHRTLNDAVAKKDSTFITDRGLRRKIRTTKGWELYVT